LTAEQDLTDRANAQNDGVLRDGGAEAIAVEQETRPAEEVKIMLVCFCTGITVGLIFLVYIMLAFGQQLP